MKTLLVIALLLVAGCLPATQSEVQTLTNKVAMIVPAVRVEIAKANVGIEDVLTKVEEVNEAVATAESPVEAIREGVKATSNWNPYAVPILAGISLLEALGVLGVNKLRKDSHNALEEVVIGVEDSKKNGGNLKVAFNATESLITRKKVAKILSNT
jgi:outer membrane murein-binding lipoprotein Lpp